MLGSLLAAFLMVNVIFLVVYAAAYFYTDRKSKLKRPVKVKLKVSKVVKTKAKAKKGK